MNNNLLIVFSGPSGCGKGTVLKKLFEINPEVKPSVSATTRKMRDGEINGESYNFMSEAEFNQAILEQKMLEYAVYCGNYYGTSKQTVMEMLEHSDVVLEIEVQGALQVIRKFPRTVSIFLMPPSEEVLEKRLRNRSTESDEVIKQRMVKAREEMKCANMYKYIVVNDEVDNAVNNIYQIIEKERHYRFSKI